MTTERTQRASVIGDQLLDVRPTANVVQLATNLQRAASDALKLNRTEPGDDVAPLRHSGRTDAQRPRDIRGLLKVLQNVGLQHETPFTTVKTRLQPQYQTKGLTSVAMEKLATISERLNDAMNEAGVSASQLARACNVTPAAVHKWLNGGKLSADNSAAAARAVGVREEWLRTGRLPREREAAEEEQQVDRVIELLSGLQGPLAELAGAIDKLNKARQEQPRKRQKA